LVLAQDLVALPEEPPVLVEGFKLLPRLVSPLLTRPNQAVWLFPTEESRRAALDSRGSTWDIPRETSDPERALANLLARDRLFSDLVVNEAAALQLRVIEVDGQLSVEEVTTRVAESLGLRTP
jgi:hypothetical protein